MNSDSLNPVPQLKFVIQVFDGPNDLAGSGCEANIPLWKLYIGGRVACHFHFDVYVRGELTPYNLCADFQRFPFSENFIVDVKDASTSSLPSIVTKAVE